MISLRTTEEKRLSTHVVSKRTFFLGVQTTFFFYIDNYPLGGPSKKGPLPSLPEETTASQVRGQHVPRPFGWVFV